MKYVLISFFVGVFAAATACIFPETRILKDNKQSYLYVYNKETNSWDKGSILDLKLTLCDNLKVSDKSEGVGK